jgi:hypothetical protein
VGKKRRGRITSRKGLYRNAPVGLLYPLVTSPPEVELCETQFTELEQAGGLRLAQQQRRRLQLLAESWTTQSFDLVSARSKEFWERLESIRTTLENAQRAIDLNQEGASIRDQHFLNWLINQSQSAFYAELLTLDGHLGTACQLATELQNLLPSDHGGSRPFGDDRWISELADIFEAAGGKALVYASEHAEDSIADTPFRRFARRFYSLLPLARKRRPRGGLDEALRTALEGRRRGREKGNSPSL